MKLDLMVQYGSVKSCCSVLWFKMFVLLCQRINVLCFAFGISIVQTCSKFFL